MEHSVAKSTLPAARDLLPNEIGLRIGCEGCTSDIATTQILTSPKSDRLEFVDNLRLVSEMTGIPVTVTGPSAFSTENTTITQNCGSPERPCVEPSNTALFEELPIARL